ncbi:helix-turn-helix domain-containing protein [Sulfitobacter sp. D7]|uniref:helix-turn-helix domain-containing protein n=1 Tax=Sulfitobacter sp. D7 TaxID=1968541 RepID=UPI000E777CB3|nr:helix-turn-helix transcriptional regulator [Sulfitobacter sp. D7]AYE87646.1 transcriptional regulator [Sulfitobacter sp. D7]
MAPKTPYADTKLAAYLTKRILELRPRKSQLEIAVEAGFINVNMMSLLKSGRSKVPLDRVAALAQALEVDPRLLFRMAIQQSGYETTSEVTDEIFGTIVSRNEVVWLEALRDASDYKDPALTTRSRAALRGLFNK